MRGESLTLQRATAGMSLLFTAGSRPSVKEVERALAAQKAKSGAAVISHDPGDDAGWLELLASGLTFDLAGLAPAAGAPMIAPRHFFGSGERIDSAGLEAVTLAPGPHVAGGGAMIPLVRVLVGLVASLSLGLRARAVC